MNRLFVTTKTFLQNNKWTLVMFTAMALLLAVMPEAHASGGLFQAQIFDPNRDLPDNIDTAGGGTTLRDIILLAINFILGFVGLIAVLMIIYGGFRLLTSGGDEEGSKDAKNIILYAIIGIIIILFSFAIINTLFDITTGSDTATGGV